MKGKGEFMIIGTLEKIQQLSQSQKRFVRDDLDVNGDIACVSVHQFAQHDFRKKNCFVTGTNQDNFLKRYKCGSQCSWLWNGSYSRPSKWQDTICSFFRTSNLKNLYVLCVFFKNGTDTYDGNPFIGGTYDSTDVNLFHTAKRELREEVGLVVLDETKVSEIPTISKEKKIWCVSADNVIDSGDEP